MGFWVKIATSKTFLLLLEWWVPRNTFSGSCCRRGYKSTRTNELPFRCIFLLQSEKGAVELLVSNNFSFFLDNMAAEQAPMTFLGLLSSTFLHYPITMAILGIGISALILYSAHLKVSDLVLNNFQTSDPWIPETELVLLTGGSSGIGRQVLEDLARHRSRIVMLDIKPPTFDLPERVSFYQVDLSSSEDISTTASAIRAAHGDPTVLVNNAGIFHHGSILEKPEREIRQTFEVNTISHFLLLKEFLPAMIRKNRGHIVTVASFASFVAVPEMVDYCCTKASALAFHEGLRQELKYWYQAPNVRTRLVIWFLYSSCFRCGMSANFI